MLISPLSFLSANLCAFYAKAKSTATISYFCGRHAEWPEVRPASTGMMISLLGQLLECQPTPSDPKVSWDFSFVDEEIKLRLEEEDLEALCYTFHQLVLQIKETMVLVCFIDKISSYETAARKAGTEFVIKVLTDLVEDLNDRNKKIQDGGEEAQGVVFKLLVTDPGYSIQLEGYFYEEEKLKVDEWIDGERSGVVNFGGLA